MEQIATTSKTSQHHKLLLPETNHENVPHTTTLNYIDEEAHRERKDNNIPSSLSLLRWGELQENKTKPNFHYFLSIYSLHNLWGHATNLQLSRPSLSHNLELVSRVGGVIHPLVVYRIIEPYLGSAWGFIILREMENKFLRHSYAYKIRCVDPPFHGGKNYYAIPYTTRIRRYPSAFTPA